MQVITKFVQDQAGNLMPNATGSLYYAGTDQLVTGLQDIDGNPLDNPMRSDAYGQLQFAAETGDYDLFVRKGAKTFTIRVEVLDLKTAQESATRAEAGAAQASQAAEDAKASSDGQRLEDSQPNLLPTSDFTGEYDPYTSKLSGSGLVTQEWRDGFKCLRISDKLMSYSVDAPQGNSGLVSASVIVQAVEGDAGHRVLLVQYDASGVEIAREEKRVTDEAMPYTVNFSSVAVSEESATIRLFFDGGTGAAWFRAPLLAEGSSSSYRPAESVKLSKAAQEADAAWLADRAPNLFPSPSLSHAWVLNKPYNYAGQEEVSGEQCAVLTGGLSEVEFSADVFGDSVSASMMVSKAEGEGVRLLIAQYAESGSEITSARAEGYTAGVTVGVPVTLSAVAEKHSEAVTVRVIFGSETSTGTVWASRFCVASDADSRYRNSQGPIFTNYALEPDFSGVNADPADLAGERKQDGGGFVLRITGEGFPLRRNQGMASGFWAPGRRVMASAMLRSDAADTAEVAYILYDADGVEIERHTLKNGATVDEWVRVTDEFTIPAGAARVVQRLTHRENGSGSEHSEFKSLFVGYLHAPEMIRSGVTSDASYPFGGYDLARAAVEEPNLWLDTNMENTAAFSGGDSTDGTGTIEGELCVKFAGGISGISFPASKFGAYITASMLVSKIDGGFSRLLIRQYSSTGTQISEGSADADEVSSVSIGSPVTASVTTTKHSSAVTITVFVGSNSVGNAWLSRFMVATGTDARYRPPSFNSTDRIQYNYALDPNFTGVDVDPENAAGTRIFSGYPYFDIRGEGSPYRLQKADCVGAWAPGNSMSVQVEVRSDGASSAELAYIFRAADGSEISRKSWHNGATLDAWVSKSEVISVPDDAHTVEQRLLLRNSSSGAGLALFRNLIAAPTIAAKYDVLVDSKVTVPYSGDNGTLAVYMAPDGDNSQDGSESRPVATLSGALSILGGYGTVRVSGGDYPSDAFSASGAVDVVVVGYDVNTPVRIMGGELLTGITKTAGATKVYQVSRTEDPDCKWLYQHGVPDARTSIADATRHPRQQGESYRLPSTKIGPVDSVAEIDASSDPSWFWDEAAGVLYFSVADGGDGAGASVYIPGGGRPFAGAAGRCLRVRAIESWYTDQGFDFSDCAYYEAFDLVAIGSRLQGIRRDGAHGVEYRCRTGGVGNDGTNGHVNVSEQNAFVRVVSSDQWSHDNYDDGDSLHERGEGSYYGGLYEWNGDRGIATSYGAHVSAFSVDTRHNGQAYAGSGVDNKSGEGFGVVGTPVVEENGVGTQMNCYSCRSVGDRFGFAAHGDYGTVNAYQCVAIDATQAGYSANGIQAVLNAENCLESGSALAKYETGGGVVNVTAVAALQ